MKEETRTMQETIESVQTIIVVCRTGTIVLSIARLRLEGEKDMKSWNYSSAYQSLFPLYDC